MALDFMNFLGNNAGAIIGGIAGAAGNSGSTTNTQTATRDPWGPAQPYIMRNLQDQQSLQDYYKKNPFSAQQQAGFNNTFADADHFRSSVAPGLLGFANNAMGGSYERQRGGAPGSGAGYGGEVRPGGMRSGLLSSGPFSVSPYISAGEAEARSTGPMPDGSAMPRVQPSGGRFGQVDFAAANPFTNGAIPAPAPAAAAPTIDTGLLSMGGGGRGSNSGMSGGSSDTMGGTKQGGIGVGEYSDAITQKAMDTAQKFGMAGPVVGVLAALMSAGIDEYKALEMVNSYEDPIGALNALQGWTTLDPAYSYSGGGGGGNGVGGYGGEGYGSGTDGSSGGYGSSYGSGSVGGF